MCVSRFEIVGLCLCLILLNNFPAGSSQTAVLKGKVWDPASNSAIPGADVNVYDIGGKLQAGTISDDKGQYLVQGLKRGESVKALYSRGGYLPNPRAEEVLLSQSVNTKDVQLLRDTRDSTYWSDWSKKVKPAVDASTSDQARRTQLYEQMWSTLSKIGFPADAQVQAARQLTDIAPEASLSGLLTSFASVKMDYLSMAEANIRAALDGEAELSNPYSIPPDVAAEIAVNEMDARSPQLSSQEKFYRDFADVWGPTGSQQLREKLSHGCEVRGKPTHACFGVDDLRNLERIGEQKVPQ